MLLESLESRILYSAGPIDLPDSTPLTVDAGFNPSADLLRQEFTEAADPVSMTEALEMVGAEIRAWNLEEAAISSEVGFSTSSTVEETPIQMVFRDGAPAPQVFRVDFNENTESVAPPAEDKVFHSEPDSEVWTLATTPVVEEEQIIMELAIEPRFSFTDAAPDRFLVFLES